MDRHEWLHVERDEDLPLDPELTECDRTPPAPIGLAAALALIAVGGFAGGVIRYAATALAPAADHAFPWALFGVNTAGAFALGVLAVALAHRALPPPYLRPLVVTGLLGALTTFSGVAAAAVELWGEGAERVSVAFVAVSTLAALAAVVAGRSLAHRLLSRRLVGAGSRR